MRKLTFACLLMLFLLPGLPRATVHPRIVEQDALVVYADAGCNTAVVATTTTALYDHPEAWFPGSTNKQQQLRDWVSNAGLGNFIQIGQRVFTVVTYTVGPH